MLIINADPAHAEAWARETAFGRSPLYMEAQLKVWAYIDGFNLYNGALRNTSFKWLNLMPFCQSLLLPTDQVDRIKFFTALVDPRVTDPDQPIRQMVYWRALNTLGCVDIIKGRFLTKLVNMPTAVSVDAIRQSALQGTVVASQRPNMVAVYRSEEKGTDVNLAAHLVHDAHLSRFDAALVVSNDSDLTEAVRIVKDEVGKVVVVYSPHRRSPSVELRAAASSFRTVNVRNLRDNQFPHTLTDSRGTFGKPPTW